MLFAIAMFRASGAMESLISLIAPVFGIYLSRVGEQKTLLTLGTVSLFLIPIFAWFFVRVKKKEK